MKKEILKIQDLVVAYGDKKIIDGLNLSIYQGEFVGIIGPNGTGKSTLVRAITNILDYQDGSIWIKGSLNKKLSKRQLAKLVAVVPQEFHIEYAFTNYDIVMMGRNPHIDRKHRLGQRDHKIVKEAMIMTNTWKFRDNFFHELSGGERQRVIIARAIAQQPSIILLDEPTSHLDIHHQLEVMELISQLKRKRGLTVVAVLHDINMAARFSDRLILLSQGKAIVQGSPEEVIQEENLSKVYHMEMMVRDNRILGKKEVIPLRVLKQKVEINDKKIHVICGGATGGKILEQLKSLGLQVSAGVINQGDSDWEICKSLNIPCIEAPPFSHFTSKEAQKNAIFIEKSDFILVTDVPYGRGNLINLELLKEIKKPIYFLKAQGKIDYTQGKATEILEQLQNKKNFHWISSYEEFLKKIIEK
ncbi:ABC transporter ATP-binding protein [Garciella nitratireducens]|uniref:ABC transporter ATP-binding protein n=1 Tax=Garciella nitratireducens TaxID=218205 RepID=UPI000DEA7455|nr:ABC transporter ATP-binding protein [Garciella nitratireducens]RBP44981.1 iron complex transport system ATP-binding protein [Garciella nitratireducens]